MENENTVNLFWAVVWAVVFICSVVTIFWKPAIFGVILPSAFLCGMFIYDYIKVKRIK